MAAIEAAERGRPCVLVVDDELAITEIVGLVLAGAGYAVAVAYDGVTALALAQQERPAVLLTDLRMPGLGGVALARWVAALPGPPVPTIAMSSSRPADLPAGVAFLPKPFELDDLLAAVAAHCLPPG